MKIVLCYTHHRRVIANYYRRAFRQLGHHVVSIGPWKADYPFGVPGCEPTHPIPWRDITIYDFPELRIDPKDYDLFILFDHGDKIIVRGIPQPWAHVALEGSNLEWSDAAFKFAGLMQHVNPAVKDVHWLPAGYDLENHRPGPPLSERQYDAIQLATPRDARMAIWSLMPKLAPDLHCYFGEVWGPCFETFHQQSRVTWATSSQDFVTMRVFEAAAMGCVIIADRTESLKKLGFIEGEHFIGYDPVPSIWNEGVPDVAFLIEQIHRIHDYGDDGMSARAQELVRDGHSWTHRATRLLEIVGVK